MPNQDYIPNDDLGKAILFERFRDTIGTYAADLGLTAPQVAAQAADATWFRYVLNYTGVIRDSGSQWVGYKNLLLHGSGTAMAPLVQTPPSPEPSATEPGIVERFRALARLIKANPVYTEPMGQALGIVGPDVTCSTGVLYQPIGYEQDIALVYTAADLLIGRGGASTVHEVAVTGIPAVLVPWAGAADDHQTLNVRWLADQDAAVLLAESDLAALPGVVAQLRADPARLATLSANAAAMGAVHRRGTLAALIERVATGT